MSAPLTDDLIARLRDRAMRYGANGEFHEADLLAEAAAALEATALPRPAMVWIVGRTTSDAGAFEFQGVFSSEAKAADACRDETYFVGPATVDASLPHETLPREWPGSRYPLLESVSRWPLTDALITRLKAHAASSEEQWDFSARDVLLEAAEALAARPQWDYPQNLTDAMNEERWKDAIYILICKVDALYKEIEKVRADAHGDGQMHAIADVNAGLVDDLIAPRLASLRASAPPAAPPPWQPIETAPKDGTWILGMRDGRWFWRVSWGRNRANELGWCGETATLNPTHWMPLQSPPASAPESEEDEEYRRHAFNSRTPYEPGDDRDIWCADCEYHRDHEIHGPASAPAAPAPQQQAHIDAWVNHVPKCQCRACLENEAAAAAPAPPPTTVVSRDVARGILGLKLLPHEHPQAAVYNEAIQLAADYVDKVWCRPGYGANAAPDVVAAPAPEPEKSDGVRILQAMNRLPVRDETDSTPKDRR